MAERPIYGRTHSENKWPMVDGASCIWTRIPGANASLQIREGLPLQIMRAFAADYNEHVEPVFDADSACWTPTNSVASSNHLSGTAMDLRWNSHPFHKKNTFNSQQMATIRELLGFYENTIWWGGDWNSPIDEMHWQMGYDTYRNPHTDDFVKRKIRSDGRSTFRRGGGPTELLTAATVLARAINVPVGVAEGLLPDIRIGLITSDCNTPLRIAHWLAQIGHESDSFRATEEYNKNGRYAPYIGRTWIQITWQENYRKFGVWCKAKGLISDSEVFVRDPQSLAALRWRAIGPAWYWTTTVRSTRRYPTCNEAADANDIVTLTQIINGGTNGLEDRQARFNRAIALGDQLMAIAQGDDELADPTVLRQIAELHAALLTPAPSQSIYRTPGETTRWRVDQLVRNIDGMTHQEHVEEQARTGNLIELQRIIKAARGQGADTSPWVIEHATAVINEIEQTNPAVIKAYLVWEAELQLRGVQ
jgi:predicted chitinase